jgi:NitT/TauT family transport system permease protein
VSRAGAIRSAVLLGAFALLELLCRTGAIAAFTLIPPSAMIAGLWDILVSGRFNLDIAVTLRNVDPLFATYYAIPVYAFYPLLMVIFGLGDLPQIAVGFLLAVVAVLINTLNGLDRVPPVLLKVARMQRMGPVATAAKIRVPFAAPYIFTGFKLCVAYAFVGVIGAEFITSARGIGYEISYAYNNFDNKVMYPLIFLVLVVVTAINMSLYAWERRLLARRQG